MEYNFIWVLECIPLKKIRILNYQQSLKNNKYIYISCFSIAWFLRYRITIYVIKEGQMVKQKGLERFKSEYWRQQNSIINIDYIPLCHNYDKGPKTSVFL